jgi:hypothetical protein
MIKKTPEEKRLAHLLRCKEYAKKFPERRRESKENWRKRNMDKYAAYARKSRLKYKDRVALNIADWSKRNAPKLNAAKAKRMADKKQATPKWANLFFIEEIYDLARLRTKYSGVKHSVDHIVPMTSKLVQGLHVEHNLRVIRHTQNISKKNRWWPDMPV